MKQPIYSLRDEVADFFNTPFIDSNNDSVRRSFGDAVLAGKINHYEDYAIYHLGDFDNKTGSIVPLDNPALVIRGNQIEVNKNEVQN